MLTTGPSRANRSLSKEPQRVIVFAEDETGDKLQDPDNVDDIYADLFDEGGEKATLLKTKYAEV